MCVCVCTHVQWSGGEGRGGWLFAKHRNVWAEGCTKIWISSQAEKTDLKLQSLNEWVRLALRSAWDLQNPGQAHFQEQRLETVGVEVLIERLKTSRVRKKKDPVLRAGLMSSCRDSKGGRSKTRRGHWKLMRFVTSKESACCGQTSGQSAAFSWVTLLFKGGSNRPGQIYQNWPHHGGASSLQAEWLFKFETNVCNHLECEYAAGLICSVIFCCFIFCCPNYI